MLEMHKKLFEIIPSRDAARFSPLIARRQTSADIPKAKNQWSDGTDA
jgi:hypothetical protein